MSGWIAVPVKSMRRSKIKYDLENRPLEIKTDSMLENDDIMKVWFMNGTKRTGGVEIRFSPSPEYLIIRCSNSNWTKLPACTVPNTQNKIWKITLTKKSVIRLKLDCNGEEMVDTMLSESTCGYDGWESIWMKRVDGIKFHDEDTVSNYYRNTILQGTSIIQRKLLYRLRESFI
jgi:hypothetical protein